MKRLITLLCLLALGIVLFGGCTKEKLVNSQSQAVNVTGIVNGWRCGIGDPYNNSGDVRYTTRHGWPATVKFVDDDTHHTYWADTDDSSVYNSVVVPGDYFAVIETRHAHPDTVWDISIATDTIIDFDILYEYTLADSIIFTFYYYSHPEDSLGIHIEMSHLRGLNGFSFGMLNLDSLIRIEVSGQFQDWYWVEYHVPTSPGVAPWMFMEKLLHYEAMGGGLPDRLYYDLGWIICLHK